MLTDALVVEKAGAGFAFQQVTVEDDPRDNEIMVEMRATGLCHTDLNFSKEKSIDGLFPAIFGHEGSGVVVKTGTKVYSSSVGDHVILTYSCCEQCKYCMNGETSYCNDFETGNFGVGRSDGSKAFSTTSGPVTSHFFGQSSFAHYAIVMASSVVKINHEVPLNLVAPLGCGIMAGAGAMINVIEPKGNSSLCITGAGAVGLGALMALKLIPARPEEVIVVDIVPERLRLAEKYGATVTINSLEVKDLAAALSHVTKGRGVDGSIDTTGRPDVVASLFKAAAKKGSVVQVGVGSLTAEVSCPMFDMVNTGRVYRGCAMGSCYPQVFIPRLIEAWQKGDFPFTDLIEEFPAHEIDRAVKAVSDGSVIKAVLSWGQHTS